MITHIAVNAEMNNLAEAIRDNLKAFCLTGTTKFYIDALDQLSELNGLILETAIPT